jgi:hypothetical protein
MLHVPSVRKQLVEYLTKIVSPSCVDAGHNCGISPPSKAYIYTTWGVFGLCPENMKNCIGAIVTFEAF